MDTKDGGAAFPRTASTGMGADGWTVHSPAFKGMSLRDYFAAKAMQGIFASGMISKANEQGVDPIENERATAAAAYLMADAMLKAREQTPSP